MQSTIINTHLQRAIFLFDKKDKSIGWRLWISNEPFLEVFIKVFTKHYNFILWQIINRSKWKLHSFQKINLNGVVVWLMPRQGVYISFLKHILEFLVLGKNFMWMSLNIWWRKNINQECISSCGSLHEGFCSNKQRLGASKSSCTI